MNASGCLKSLNALTTPSSARPAAPQVRSNAKGNKQQCSFSNANCFKIFNSRSEPMTMAGDVDNGANLASWAEDVNL